MHRFNLSTIAVLTLFVVLIGSLVCPVAVAQDDDGAIVLGQQITIHSDVLDEDRTVYISMPLGYEGGSRDFPVLYLLDGMAHFHHTIGTMTALAGNGRMPRFIVVAIGNTDRTRDLTLPHSDGDLTERMPTSGGADDFLEFIETELIPYVESNYRTASYRMLIGHSFGGLFATYAMLYSPETFNSYIAISPSLWWNDDMLAEKARTFFDDSYIEPRAYYVTMGAESEGMLESFEGFKAVLKEYAPDSFTWGAKLLKQENHGTTPYISTYHGLRLIFADWDGTSVFASGDLDKIQSHYNTLQKKYGYSIQPPEGMLNTLGYQYLGADEFDKALKVFEYNVSLYPESANVYDSLGECLENMDDYERAMKNYAKAVQLAEKEDGYGAIDVYKANLKRMEELIGDEF